MDDPGKTQGNREKLRGEGKPLDYTQTGPGEEVKKKKGFEDMLKSH